MRSSRGLGQALAATGLCLCAAVAWGESLPEDIQSQIRDEYGSTSGETRYLDGAVDLDGDAKPEILVYVVSPEYCGTGGCPTLVFAPDGSGHRLVSTIGLTRPPIRVSDGRTRGWRNLIVHVGGGGARADDVELSFDGKSYPGNPTVPGAHVKRGAGAGATVVIEDFPSFDSAKLLPPAAASPVASAPSFDCTKASSAVEKAICTDPKLAGLDRTLADAYGQAMRQWDEATREKERAAQRTWIAQRNACGKSHDPKGCIEASYTRRLVEVQITGGLLTAPTPVGFVCKGHEREQFLVSYYNQTDPPSAVITFGDRQVIALATPTGSGARYTAPAVDFWEHQGEATVVWSGVTYSCTPR
jgi:uncharacterized protein